MTEFDPDDDPDTAPIPRLRAHERRRAALALVILAVGAVGFVAILVAALGVGKNSTGGTSAGGVPTGPAVTVVSSGPGSQSAPSTSAPVSQGDSGTSTPTGPVSCPTTAPCALSFDVGDVAAALNTYRTRHHRGTVVGRVTQAAKTCAVTSGDQCPAGYYWEPVGRSGTEVIHKIVSSGRDNGQLLDANLKSVQIGWAYVPTSKSFECVLIVPPGG